MAKEGLRRITVFAGRQEPSQYNWSPFVNKLQARLRFADITYDITACSLSQAPRGKIPFVSLSHDATGADKPSTLMADTGLITKHLIETGELPDLNRDLGPVELARDLGLRALLEDKVYFMQTHERWLLPPNYLKMRDAGPLAPIPYPLRLVIGLLAWRKNVLTLQGQGVARYSAEELQGLRGEAWGVVGGCVAAVAAGRRTGDGKGEGGREGEEKAPFWALGGDHPTEFDATLFGFLSAVLTCSANPDSQATVRSHPALLEYAGRIHDAYFPDYVKWEE